MKPTPVLALILHRQAALFRTSDNTTCQAPGSGGMRIFSARASDLGTSQRNRNVAAIAPASSATTNGGTSTGRTPANVSESDRAIVTAGFANDVDEVNQYAAVM